MPPKKKTPRPVPKNVKTYVRKAIREEKETKQKYLPVQQQDVTTTAAFIALDDGITQGDGHDERIGDTFKIVRTLGRLQFFRDSTSTANTWNNVRCLLVQWYPDSFADPLDNLDQLLADPTTTPYLSPITGEGILRSKFNILLDKWYTLGSRGSTGDPNMGLAYRNVRFSIGPNKLRKTHFNDGAVTGKNKLYLVVFGDQANGNDNSSLLYSIQHYFKDD